MKIATTCLVVLTFFVIGHSQTPPKSQPQVGAVFESFYDSLAKLTKRDANWASHRIDKDIVASLDSITENVKFLEAVLAKEKTIPKEYLESLALDADLLKKLARQKTRSATELQALSNDLKDVESDLAIKITGPRAGGDIARVVEVIVHAKKGTDDVGAYQVWYVSKGWVKDPSRFKPFDRLTDPSNPSSMKLAPGNYLIWLSKGKPVTDRQPARIGENGETKKVIDVPLP